MDKLYKVFTNKETTFYEVWAGANPTAWVRGIFGIIGISDGCDLTTFPLRLEMFAPA